MEDRIVRLAARRGPDRSREVEALYKQDLVALLERLIARVKEGEIAGFIGLYFDPSGGFFDADDLCHPCVGLTELAGALGRLHHYYNHIAIFGEPDDR